MKFNFKPLTFEDLPQLHRWFQEPMIRQLYAKNQSYSLEDMIQKYKPRLANLDHIPSFIIEYEQHQSIRPLENLQEFNEQQRNIFNPLLH